MIVASMVATTFSLPLLMAKASAVQTVKVRPALLTCALAAKASPAAGARRFTHKLAVSGPYAHLRHPQYLGLIAIMVGFLLQPTVLTVVMFPILVWMYVRLARRERDAAAEFGHVYDQYVAIVPAFVPRLHSALPEMSQGARVVESVAESGQPVAMRVQHELSLKPKWRILNARTKVALLIQCSSVTFLELRAMQAIDQLVAQHSAFRSFVAKRVVDEQTAEDILQTAYAKAMERQHQIRNEESVVAWFYRLLRNAIADHYRRAAVDEKRLQYDNDADLAVAAPELQKAACECVLVALDSLKPDYANALRQVDVAGTAVQVFAQHEGISSDNASVRLHRARKALTKQIIGTCGVCAEHKCIDCDCRPAHKRQL